MAEAEEITAGVLDEYASLELTGSISAHHRAQLRRHALSSAGGGGLGLESGSGLGLGAAGVAGDARSNFGRHGASSFFDPSAIAQPVQLFPSF